MKSRCKNCGMYPMQPYTAICAKCEQREEQRLAWLEERFDEVVHELAGGYPHSKLASLIYAINAEDMTEAKRLLDRELNKMVDKLIDGDE